MAKIEVKLNPDVTPSGSDLTVVNAARRSFNTRSDWEWFYPAEDSEWDSLSDEGWVPTSQSCLEWRKLKDKDKRLIQFLARGMAADDFDSFLGDIEGVVDYIPMQGDNTDYQKLTGLLWQWRNTPTHGTPFNHCFISFEVKAPIFVRAQLV